MNIKTKSLQIETSEMGLCFSSKKNRNYEDVKHSKFQVVKPIFFIEIAIAFAEKEKAKVVTHDTINIHASLVRASACFHFI